MKIYLFILYSLFTGLCSAQCDSISELNRKIVELAKAKKGKKVDRGECWDLAKYVLDETDSKWDGKYEYGRKLNKGECLMPGDIIQFEKVKVQYKVNNSTYSELMTHHTAIIYEVISEDEVILIHQNTGQTGRKVGTSKLKFSTVVKGTYFIYRPFKD